MALCTGRVTQGFLLHTFDLWVVGRGSAVGPSVGWRKSCKVFLSGFWRHAAHPVGACACGGRGDNARRLAHAQYWLTTKRTPQQTTPQTYRGDTCQKIDLATRGSAVEHRCPTRVAAPLARVRRLAREVEARNHVLRRREEDVDFFEQTTRATAFLLRMS